ncbi:hypothetical protein P171DRAFT_113884 [Karstenula rhodostoma CBS 690.94]|uniref:Protein kinase domain-containing protein n=1 Tax=Karstenula rhodostoma CBS 690.94 TaxID=1392251 RepID=A0A9P4P9Q8_9PLEO|nr:hypothetical protein P171DRAFT_113884 [Karstenula rhodostoma CBS 690.94]
MLFQRDQHADVDGRRGSRMAVIENFKNFLRHGKQARGNAAPHGEPTTNVSNVHAQHQPQRHNNHPEPHHAGISEPVMHQAHKEHVVAPHGDFSVGAVGNRNIAAKAGDVAARAAGDKQKQEAAAAKNRDIDPTVLERIVAEEREAKGKLPKYPGLERWKLVEKMGDGAFSNVYRARDNDGQHGEVAIKVVRKFEMNSSQVSMPRWNYPVIPISFYLHPPPRITDLRVVCE